MYCNNEIPLAGSVIEFEYYATGAYATAFLFMMIAKINSL
jgi:hypothetical protein